MFSATGWSRALPFWQATQNRKPESRSKAGNFTHPIPVRLITRPGHNVFDSPRKALVAGTGHSHGKRTKTDPNERNGIVNRPAGGTELRTIPGRHRPLKTLSDTVDGTQP